MREAAGAGDADCKTLRIRIDSGCGICYDWGGRMAGRLSDEGAR